jgi:outer membrane lipoprotein-sorting protein
MPPPAARPRVPAPAINLLEENNRMQRKLSLVILALLVALPMLAQDMTVDQVIAKHIEAQGGMAKMKTINTAKVSGRIQLGPGIEAPIVIYKRRPDQSRMELSVQGLTMVRAYDGTSKTGWVIMPFQGKKDPEQMTADDVKEAADASDFDGPLVDYAAKGHKVELLGKEKIEGSDAYKLKLTKKSGDVETIYIDADSFLEIRSEGKRMIRGSEVETESTMGDYKEVGGLVVPFSMQEGAKGHPEKQNITIDKYEFNVPVDAAMFNMPPPAPKAATPEEKKEPTQTKPSTEAPKTTTDKPKN